MIIINKKREVKIVDLQKPQRNAYMGLRSNYSFLFIYTSMNLCASGSCHANVNFCIFLVTTTEQLTILKPLFTHLYLILVSHFP